ncbi:EAL domain-containing protein [Thermovorax subterraneus]|nr:EAL domain-containing protein [Thermovorax subterraneus]
MEDLKILKEIIENKEIRTFFQPIVDVNNLKIIGYEALSRGPAGSPLERPDVMFDVAAKYNLLWQLEYLCRVLAIENASRLGLKDLLFLNVDPRILKDERFTEGFTYEFLKKYNIRPEQIIFEITEKTAITDYVSFRRILEHYRKQGYKIAVDDTGNGYAGIMLIAEIRPQFIKLDMGLIRNIDKDELRQMVCQMMVNFSKLTNMKIISEGVETEDELNTLIKIGCEYVQGYYLGRPCETLSDISPNIMEKIENKKRENGRIIFNTSKTFPIGNIARLDKGVPAGTKSRDVKQIKEIFSKRYTIGNGSCSRTLQFPS